MADLNRRRVAKNHEIAVSLSGDGERASIFVKAPSGRGTHEVVEISALLDGGMSEGEALDFIAKVVEIGVMSSTEFGNG
ncbi:hypothetical protein PQH03_04745 [Ralstonia insidiosa]|jgi:hypothetical protein|uniref:hypothetical protein n=1 Tax=Ralstonia TaxID=48736 RepID=UPI000664996A|nr:hypothetical protein [Ralstonia insidiosa]KMW48869.1 hypothetical protein AC240_03065 [Ralstonia sp. MD27]MBX3773404.1 hypothetical protein [Ralstonia pickettii]NOZ18820.1 hypothetical protein [Betaproteobacteria bacterium]MBA9857244.1 hypothetical protein [Ralstonia insidiosa]MBA9870573.1 hypothetical protein [Ralstonia insidiosa]